MALERNGAQHQMAVPDKFHDPLVDYEMTTRDYTLRPNAVDEAAAITITLPPVADAKGRMYSILIPDGGASAAYPVTVEDNNDDSEDWIADIVFYEDGQGAWFYSDGRKWMIFPSGVRAAQFTSSRVDNTYNINTDRVQLILDAASAVNQCETMRVTLFSDVQLGAWGNAVCAVVNLMDSGYVTGLIGVVCAELDMPGGAVPGGSGTYWLYEAEVNLPTSYVGGGVPIAILGVNVWGDEATQFDDAGFLFDINGVTSGAGDFFYDHTANAADGFLKCRINGDTYYLALSDDQAWA